MGEDKLKQRIIIRIEAAATLALDARAPDLSPIDRHVLVSQVEAQLGSAKSDCTATSHVLQALIRQQSD